MSPCKGKSFKISKAFAFAGRLYFILREMTHDEPASETQHQYDDGEYHGCSVGSVLNILLRGAQLEEHAQGEGGCLLV